MTNISHYRAEIYTRGFIHHYIDNSREQVLNTLNTLVNLGVIDEFESHTWMGKISKEVDEEGKLSQLTDRKFKEFHEWAINNDASLKPFFQEEKINISTMMSGQKGHTTIKTLPVMALALYRDDLLEAVYPHTQDGDYRNITDCLDALKELGVEEALSDFESEIQV